MKRRVLEFLQRKIESFHPVALLLALVVVSLGSGGALSAQRSQGGLSGSVEDQAGAAVPNAEVDVLSKQTGVVRKVTTDATGTFVLPDLEPGEYDLTATAAGMQTEKRTGIIVTTGVINQIRVQMHLGQVNQTIEVEASAYMVNSTDATVSDLVSDTEVKSLPIDVRSVSALLRTEPGVTPGAITTKETGVNTDTGGFVAGQRAFDAAFTVDGGNASPVVWPQPLWALVTNGGISPDAIREFRVYTTNKPADGGGKSGSLEAITTKSGTSEFHGSLFEYLRNTVLDARNFFDKARLPYKQNQYGGSLGGPIWRKKSAYFFGNYEGFRSRQLQSSAGTVPTPALLAMIPGGAANGYLREIYQDTFPAYIAGTSTNGLVGTGIGTYDTSITKDMGLGRVDISLPHQSELTMRYMQVTGHNGYGAVGGSPIIGASTNEVWAGNNALVRLTTIFSSNMVNEVHVDYDRHNYDFGAQPPPQALISLGFSPISGAATSLPVISVTGTGLSNAGNPTFLPELRHENSFEYADSLSWTHGSHAMAFGVQILRQQANMVAANNFNRSVVFDGFGSGLDAASCTLCVQYGLTTGVFQTQTQTLFNIPGDNGVKGYRITAPSLFAHDTYRVSRKLTLDVGLRWTYNSPFTEANGRLNNLYVKDSSGNPIPDAPVTIYNIANTVLATSTSNLPYTKKIWNQFAPNIGINWDPFGNGKTAISAGYSLAYERPYMQYMYNVGSNVPYVTLSQVSGQQFGYFAQLGTSAAVSNPALTTYDPGQTQPFVQYWNFEIQRELTPNTSLTVTYMGNKGEHLYVYRYPNGGSTYTNYAAHTVRPNPNYGIITEITTDARSNYDGLAIALRRQLGSGLSYKIAYTYSKSLDDASAGTYVPVDETNINLDYGPSDFDIRQVFAGNVIYELPFGRNGFIGKCSQGVACKLISGWQLSTIFSANSGQPITITSGSDNNQDGNTNDRAFLIPGASLSQLFDFNRTFKSQYLNPAAKGTILATTGTEAQMIPRNSVNAPSFIDVDMEARKQTAITEKLNSTFIVQSFNIANRANFGTPVVNLNSGTFGQLQTVLPHGTGRVFQFALRLDF